MDNTGEKGDNLRGSNEQMLYGPEAFDASNGAEMNVEQAGGDMRANSNAETRRMQAELNQFFEEQKAKQSTAEAEAAATPEEVALVVKEVEDIPINANAKSLNKALGQKVLGIMKRNEKDPNQLSEDFNALRKYYLDKTKGNGLGLKGGK